MHIDAGVAALVLILLIGARPGFGRDWGGARDLPLVMLGSAILWFGWFGLTRAATAVDRRPQSPTNTLVARPPRCSPGSPADPGRPRDVARGGLGVPSPAWWPSPACAT
ncbi:hypothetical protein QJS66_01030 [Kocuria rhizophila]|nr:hypothetical protein QJS66_01030 [Kocuria rhizophila]